VRNGGTLILNAAQLKGLPEALLGVRLTNQTAEATSARCLGPGEDGSDLTGQMFRYEKVELKGATPFVVSETRDPLVTVNQVGKGRVVFCALPDLLGEDERVTPFAAHMLTHVFADASPVKVRGDVEYLLNRISTGWVVTLFNNNGVFKPQQGMAQVDRGAYVGATISAAQIQSATDWLTDQPLKTGSAGNTVTVSIAPGAMAIIELRTKD
jgi:hypothetical protein